jgi:tripartite-type tricarboxylate transporter receptor subunit TctC
MIDRRTLLAAVPALALAPRAEAQAGPMRFVVPFPPGGPTDLIARLLAQMLPAELGGRQIIVENRAGAGGSAGAELVARAAPDGDTLLVGTVSTQVLNKGLYANLSYDPLTAFAPVALLAEVPLLALIPPAFPAADAAAFLAEVRANPGRYSYASPGNGTIGHLTGALFCQQARLQMEHVPYRGSAPAISDLMGGRVHLIFDAISSTVGQIRSGAVKAIATATARRLPQVPDVPTFEEGALPGFQSYTWNAVMAPKETPAATVERLNAAINRVLASDAMKARAEELGLLLPAPNFTPADFARYIEREAAKWLPIVQSTGVRLD